ncbi:hypothetical protein L7F22_054508 [Adiantum nelumboides]|nr:hypothetical protein [Adiantum nelumboides]
MSHKVLSHLRGLPKEKGGIGFVNTSSSSLQGFSHCLVRPSSQLDDQLITGDDWDTWHDLQSHFDVARDFAAAGLIGAPGLLGFSWPDLDMLPIGFLTDPGADHGPNRLSRLSLEEQRTQMTLWAMARSPLMFGGDMVNVDDTTIDILTNQIALEINGNSYGNTEVQISGVEQHDTPSVKLLGSFTARKQNKITTQQFRAGRVLIHENWPSCLEALVNAQNTFSPCSQQRTQIWHVKPDKKLVNQRTKLCAVVNQLNYTGSKQRHFDTRIWMARGLGGDFYVAFFNLQKRSVDISVPLIGIVEEGLKLSRATNYTNLIRQWVDSRMDYQCKGKEAWSNQDVEAGSGILHAILPPHGCALFSLQCSFELVFGSERGLLPLYLALPHPVLGEKERAQEKGASSEKFKSASLTVHL